MPRPLRFAVPLVAAAAASMAPAAASAAPRAPEPLVVVAPTTSAPVIDRVLPTKPAGAGRGVRAFSAASRVGAAYQAPDGTTVGVAFSPTYAPDPATAQSYVDFLATLPHGPELASLNLLIVPPAEIEAACGGGPGVLACYGGPNHQMIVPGEQIAATTGISTAYVITHEYGHHIAAFRSNDPFAALDYGPKYWSSYEGVCKDALAGKLAPGSETDRYLENPGEGWAEAYARLTFPQEPWRFTPLLTPDAGALAAARRDVLTPWSRAVKRVFRGRFGPRGTKRTFKFALTLDGALRLALSGPRGTNFDISVGALGRSQGSTRARGSHDVLAYKAACRQQPSETVVVTVRRRSGAGAFSLTATYAG